MTLTLNLIASGSGIEWSRPLMIGWIVIALALTIIELFWLRGGFSSRIASKAGQDLGSQTAQS